MELHTWPALSSEARACERRARRALQVGFLLASHVYTYTSIHDFVSRDTCDADSSVDTCDHVLIKNGKRGFLTHSLRDLLMLTVM